MNYITAVTNQKGGTGKTTSTLNIGAGLNQRGYKVLLIDLDPQGSLSISAGVDTAELSYTVYELLKGVCEAKDTVISLGSGFDIIPADIRLAVADIELNGIAGREFILKEALEPIIDAYDFVYMDCSPSLGVLTLNALALADEVLIPMQAEPLALAGMSSLISTIKTINKRINPNIFISGILITKWNSRKNLNSFITDQLKSSFSDIIYNTKIRDNIALAEATNVGQDIFTYDSKSNGAIDYTNLINEMLERKNLR